MQESRLFEMVYRLLERESIPAREFAERFGVSVRTVYRDVDRLSLAGIPVCMTQGQGGGISLLAGWRLDRTALTQEERRQILAALQALRETVPGEPDEGLGKLRAFFGPEEPDWLEVDFGTWTPRPGEQALFSVLKTAILQRRIVTFLYAGHRGSAERRIAEPLRLVYRSNSWYLLAWCRARQDIRFFRLSRMRDLVITREIFPPRTPPAREEPPPAPQEISVLLRFDPRVESRVLDDFGDALREEDGSLTVRGPIPRLPWLVQLLLGYGSACRVEEPEWLRTALREELRRTLAFYETEE